MEANNILFLPIYRRKKTNLPTGLFALFDAWQLNAGLSCPSPFGQHSVLCKFVPDEFVLLRRAFTDKQQIKQKAQSFD